MPEQEQNRTEAATPFKLREARRRGQVAKSLEVNSLVILATALGLLYAAGERVIQAQLAISRDLLARAHSVNLQPDLLLAFVGELYGRLFSAFWLVVAAIVAAAVLANLLQTGPIFSFFPLKPDFSRMNPANGFKRVFSKRLLFETIKTLLKLALILTVVYFVMIAVLPLLMSLLDRDPASYPLFLLYVTRNVLFKLVLAVVFIALIDLAFTRWDFGQRMRMSRREVREELRRREGDPQVRARLRELQREAAKRSGSVKRLPEADVLITNPTHLAVALAYRRGEMDAPEVVAKGLGDQVAVMREIARKHNVPVVQDKALARALFREVNIDQPIPEALFPAVARTLAKVYRSRDGATALEARS